MDQDKTIALLIDSENISDKYMEIILDEVNKYGKLVIRRIYGDFTTSEHAGWKRILQKYGLNPMQQFSYTQGKNSTDSAIIIDAMDILRDGRVDCFCLATSDSDFTKLAIRLKESGIFVIAAGEMKTPKVFVNTCDRFILVDQLYKASEKNRPQRAAKPSDKPEKQEKPADVKKQDGTRKQKLAEKPASAPLTEKEDKEQEKVSVPNILEICSTAGAIISDISDESGNAVFATVISELYKTHPEFDSRHYGFKKPVDMFKQRREFVLSTNSFGAYVIRNVE